MRYVLAIYKSDSLTGSISFDETRHAVTAAIPKASKYMLNFDAETVASELLKTLEDRDNPKSSKGVIKKQHDTELDIQWIIV